MNSGTWSYYVELAQLRCRTESTPVYVAYLPGRSPKHASSMVEAEELCRGVEGAFVEVEFCGGEQ